MVVVVLQLCVCGGVYINNGVNKNVVVRAGWSIFCRNSVEYQRIFLMSETK